MGLRQNSHIPHAHTCYFTLDGLIITLRWLTEVNAPVSESTSGTSEGGHTGRDVSIGECVRQRKPPVQNRREKRAEWFPSSASLEHPAGSEADVSEGERRGAVSASS